MRAPHRGLYLLAKGPENKIEPVGDCRRRSRFAREYSFFARDPEFVKLVFDAAFDFVSRVPVRRLTFVPDAARLGADRMNEQTLCGSKHGDRRARRWAMKRWSCPRPDSTLFTLNEVATVILGGGGRRDSARGDRRE